jgi:hypothetical protein
MAEAKRPSRIDVHHHFYAPEYLAVMGDMAKRPIVRDWSVARSLEEMDKNGIGTAVLSLSPPGPHHVGNAAARTSGQRACDENAVDASGALRAFRFGADAGRGGYACRDRLLPRHARGGRHSIHDKLWRALSRPSRFHARHGGIEPSQRIGLASIRWRLSAVHRRSAGSSSRCSSSPRTPTAASLAFCSPERSRASQTYASSSAIARTCEIGT